MKSEVDSDGKDNAAEAYEEYLLLLQQRNRLLAKLKEKDDKQLELERREQGFSLYLNGANVGLHFSSPNKSRQRVTKTAGERAKGDIKSEVASLASRAKTAPCRSKNVPSIAKAVRKGWNQSPPDAIKIKTEKGDKVKVELAGVYSGKYSDDFELYQSYLEMELNLAHKVKGNDNNSESDDDIDLECDLSLTAEDVKVLRASLENDSSIRESIASVVSTSPIPEELTSDSEEENITVGDGKDITEELVDIEIESDDNDSSASEDDKEKEASVQLNKQNEILELRTGDAPRARPISASRKRVNLSIVDPIVSKDVCVAIAEENRILSEYQGKRNLKTPLSPNFAADFETKESKSVARSTNGISDQEIVSITDKVKSLTGRQQKKLLQMLGKIDVVEGSINESWDSRKDKNKQYLEEEKNNRKPSPTPSFLDDSLNKSTFHDNNTDDKTSEICEMTKSISTDNIVERKTSPAVCPQVEYENILNVVIQFLSNWGNKNYIGLTEVQFFDSSNNNIKIAEEDIVVDTSSIEDLKNLINSKTRTTKQKYMWKCRYSANESVKIIISLRNFKLSNLGKIVLWNYNSSLQELNIGVKECIVFIDGELSWQGIIEKGCGNQIFDYSNTISIHDSSQVENTSDGEKYDLTDSHTTDYNDKNVDRGVEDEDNRAKSSQSDIVDYSDDFKRLTILDSIPAKEPKSSKACNSADAKSSKSINSTDAKEVKSSKSSPEKISTVSDVKEIRCSKSPMKNKNIQKRSVKSRESPIERSSSSTGKPVWLEGPKVKEQKGPDLFLEGKKVALTTPPCGRRSQQSITPDFLGEVSIPVRKPTSGRRSQQSSSPDADDDVNTNKELDDLFDLDSMPRCTGSTSKRELNLSSKNRFSAVPPPCSSGPLMLDMPVRDNSETQRQHFKEVMDINLDQSLRSINNFNFRHLGRITAESTLDDDDEIMSLLKPMKQKDTEALQQKSLAYDESQKESGDSPEERALFELPILPKGKDLIINIKSTWGDKHYVGLNGIEVFSISGGLIKIKSIQAHPADINVLPEFDGDPRVVSNLIDNCYLTRDDLHLWLTPFTPGGDHFLELEFEEETEVAMIRIWNYNKSRIHSTRGACFVEMALNGKLIFIGEIARASGVLSKEDPYGDTILFTTDEDILLLVAGNDFTYEVDTDDDEDFLITSRVFVNDRPTTPNKAAELQERPYTCPKSRSYSREGEKEDELLVEEQIQSPDDGFMQCKILTIFFCETWGDQHYLGLTGLEVLGETFEKIPLEMAMLEAYPKDLNDLEEYDDDDRTLDKVINEVNVTTSDENMWLIPFDENGTHILKILFNSYTIVTGLRLWNYNKSLEDTFRGAKTIHVYLDDHIISPQNGFLLRKGPGHGHFDFAQDILFNNPDALSQKQYPESAKHRKINLQKIVNEYETIMMPSGFVFQFKLFSSWGDQYYIGLNGIEVYDKVGNKINLSDNNVTAYPHSVNILNGVDDDVRTPDKLVNNVNDTYDGRQMWLAPILPGQVNIVYIVFDEPITISMIKIWNYSKTAARGVRTFGLLVDDLLVYSGVLPQHILHSTPIAPGIDLPVTHHTILFTDSEEIALKERKHAMSSSISFPERNIQLTNDNAILNPYKKNKNEKKAEADPSMRPMTSVKSVDKFQNRR